MLTPHHAEEFSNGTPLLHTCSLDVFAEAPGYVTHRDRFPPKPCPLEDWGMKVAFFWLHQKMKLRQKQTAVHVLFTHVCIYM
jgi:hypothetical protein